MLIGKIDAAIASARLWVLLLKMRDPTPFYKIWGTIVLNQARANAAAKGGRFSRPDAAAESHPLAAFPPRLNGGQRHVLKLQAGWSENFSESARDCRDVGSQ